MVTISWRAVVATGLSLWLGVLACLLGCAMPAVAASPERSGSTDVTVLRFARAGICPERGGGEVLRYAPLAAPFEAQGKQGKQNDTTEKETAEGDALPSKVRPEKRRPYTADAEGRATGADDSCCQHGHSGGPEKKDHHAKSCCPTETALTQKNELAPAGLVALQMAAFTVPNVDTSVSTLESENSGVAALGETGRDILRQVRVLRI